MKWIFWFLVISSAVTLIIFFERVSMGIAGDQAVARSECVNRCTPYEFVRYQDPHCYCNTAIVRRLK